MKRYHVNALLGGLSLAQVAWHARGGREICLATLAFCGTWQVCSAMVGFFFFHQGRLPEALIEKEPSPSKAKSHLRVVT